MITAITPERKGIETQTFQSSEAEVLQSWLAERNKTDNCYFHVNPVLRWLDKKASCEDVKELAWLHVDLDPRAGEDLDEERERALRLLHEPPANLPAPTCIVFSGGGYQGFWKLENPLPINGQESVYEEAKRYNIQLEILFGADNCHNVDRIMRLPGTINWPDKKKKSKGRKPALAEVIALNPERVYRLEQFAKAPEVQCEVGFAGGQSVKVSGNIERLGSVDDARLAAVPDLTKVVIVQGSDPEDPAKFPSRSEALFYVCCSMVRAGCDDDTIFAVITDPGFGISSSVLDKGSSAEKYAIRQIERAREDAIEPKLRELNERHAVISNWGGKCRVVEEVYDPVMDRYRLTKQSFEDFRNRYMNQFVLEEVPDRQKGGTKTLSTPLGKWWLQHPNRRQFNTIVFAPGTELPGAYNLWRGFACEAKPGDCSLFKEHMLQNICENNQEYYDYLWGWMANAVQHPASPGYSAVVLRGKQGVGKSFMAKTLGHLFGRHFLQVSNPSHIVGNFNAHLRDCVLLFGEEAFYAGDKKHESILKMIITEDMIPVEPKGVDVEMSNNCLHLIMASNEAWVVPASWDDRRFFVLDVGLEHKEDRAYFARIAEQLQNGGYSALLHELLSTDLSTFEVRKVPKTRALQEQKLHSMSIEEEWWFSKLKQGLVFVEDSDWSEEICVLDLQNDFISYARLFNNSRRGNATKLGQNLKRFLPPGFPEQEQRSTPIEVKMLDGEVKMVRRPYYYQIPNLQKCRDHWDLNYGGPYEWGRVVPAGQPLEKDIPF